MKRSLLSSELRSVTPMLTPVLQTAPQSYVQVGQVKKAVAQG